MKKEPTGSISVANSQTDWERVRTMSHADVHAAITSDPDVNATDENFWKTAHVVMPRSKKTVTMRLDAEVFEWFKKQGEGHLTRMNAVLRSYVEAHTEKRT